MIQSIGIQKVLLLIILAVIAVGGYFYNTSMFGPSLLKKERQVRSVQASLNQKTAETNKLISGVNLFNEQKEEFEVIQKSGFFDDQDRVIARKRLDNMQLESNLKSFRYTISPAETVSSDALKDAGYKILRTDLELDLGAIDDTDINTFLYLLNHGFPGQILISSVEMDKKLNLTQPLLRNIGMSQAYQPLVTAKVEAEWFTMVRDDENTAASGQGQ